MKFIRIFILILVILLLATSCGNTNISSTEARTDISSGSSTESTTSHFSGEGTQAETSLAVTDPPVIADISLKGFTIVYQATSTEAKGAANQLQGILSYLFRSSFKVQADTKEQVEKEILIGQTNRSEKIDISSFAGLDNAYRIVSENRILIDAGSPIGLKEAINRFATEQLDYNVSTQEGKPNLLAKGELNVYRADYPISSMTVNGKPISDYALLHDGSSSYKKLATDFQDYVLRSVGVCLSMSEASQTDSPQTSAFLFGSIDENGLKSAYDYGYSLSGAKTENGKTFIYVCGDSTIASDLSTSFNEKYATTPSTLNVTYPSAQTTYIYQKYLRDWTFVSSTPEVTLAEGITYSRVHYTAGSNNVDFAVLKIKNGSAKFLVGTKNDGTELVESRAPLTAQVQAAVNNGKQVVAAINADFFLMEGDGSPVGSVTKDGQLLRTSTGRPWFAMYRDGSIQISNHSKTTVNPNDVYTMVGGDPILLYEGKLYPMTRSDGKEYKMRTLIGYNDDGDVYIVASDTQSGGSATTITLFEAGRYMRDLGCTYALGFDGGGSTEMVLRDPTTGNISFGSEGYAYGGGVERNIYDSLLVVIDYEIPPYVPSEE